MDVNHWARAAFACFVTGLAGAYHLCAAAQDYPNHPIRLIVGFAPGGNTDMMARLTAEQLTARLGQSVVVENRAGAGGTVATVAVSKAAPDGYTLLFASTSHAINAATYKKLPYDTLKGFQAVAPVARTPKVLVVNPSLPVHNVKEFIAYVKSHPGLTMASGGPGSSAHFAGLFFNTLAGTDVTYVPYKGTGEALRDLVSGEVLSSVDSVTAYVPLIKSGQLRALGVGSAKPMPLLPDVPAISESGLPSPALMLKDGKLAMTFGTPGLDVQPQAMAQLILNVVDYKMDVQAAIEQPRVATFNFPASQHPHNYTPGLLCAEGRIPESTLAELAALGHQVTKWPDFIASAGALCAICVDTEYGPRAAGADPRRTAYAMGW